MTVQTVRRIISGIVMAGVILFVVAFAGTNEQVSTGQTGVSYWIDVPVSEKPQDSEKLLSLGRKLYWVRCIVCHGKGGDGRGMASIYLGTKPRDFTTGLYKFRTTTQDTLPAEEDLYRSITAGIPQYGMPSFYYLAVEERWALVQYLKTFSQAWKWWDKGRPLAIGKKPAVTDDVIALGKKLYASEFECLKCHGTTGDGDGPSAAGLKDDQGNPIRTRSFSLGPTYFKLGNRPEDIVRLLFTGMPGSPMPSYASVLSEAKDLTELWAIAFYVQELSQKKSGER